MEAILSVIPSKSIMESSSIRPPTTDTKVSGAIMNPMEMENRNLPGDSLKVASKKEWKKEGASSSFRIRIWFTKDSSEMMKLVGKERYTQRMVNMSMWDNFWKGKNTDWENRSSTTPFIKVKQAIIEGYFHHNEKSGKGKIIFEQSGVEYEGEFYHNQPHGKGEIKKNDRNITGVWE